MNTAAFQQGQQSYERRDFVSALDFYNVVINDQNFPLQSGEFGLVYHQIGNCYVKLQNYSNAISAYINSCSDKSYISLGTVYYNMGMAYAYMSDFGNAIKNFEVAINTPNYRSKFKAYTAMGNALMKSGKSAEAAAAFRSAAMDAANPDPTRALLNLGVCFMALDRPVDAITVYETTFQYNMSPDFKNRLYANLGQAYVACGHMQKAINAFEESLRDKTYKLSDSASVDYQRAIGAVSKGSDDIITTPAFESLPNMDNQENSQQAFDVENQDNNYDHNLQNVDPNVNDADQEQFEKWSQATKDAAYKPQTKKSPFKIVLIIFLFVLAGCIIAGAVLFCFGFGIPSQEMVAKDYFANPVAAKDKDFSNNLSDSQKNSFCNMINPDSNAKIEAVNRSVNDSIVYVKSKTDKGADVAYRLKMSRDILGWKISNVELTFASSKN